MIFCLNSPRKLEEAAEQHTRREGSHSSWLRQSHSAGKEQLMDDLHFGMSVSIPPLCSTENFLFIWSHFQCLLLARTLPWEWVCQQEIQDQECGRGGKKKGWAQAFYGTRTGSVCPSYWEGDTGTCYEPRSEEKGEGAEGTESQLAAELIPQLGK